MFKRFFAKLDLYGEAHFIEDKSIKDFVFAVLDVADPRFWTDPSSSSGKWHPPEDQGEGGIIRHELKAIEVAKELSRYYNLDQKEMDMTLAATILHDINKNGVPWKDKTDYEHGLITYNLLEKFKLEDKEVKETIRNAVRYHMWKWCQPESELERALKPNKIENIVQLADYIASRKGISFMPGIPTRGYWEK